MVVIRDAASLLREGGESDDDRDEDEDEDEDGEVIGRGMGLDTSLDQSRLAGVSMVDVPVMPEGDVLEIRVLSTWGDPHYVGLCGLDVFDGDGLRIGVSDGVATRSEGGRGLVTYAFPGPDVEADAPPVVLEVAAQPGDVNVLEGYEGDPRTAEKLLDGHGFTRDDLHSWLAPWTPGGEAVISVRLSKKAKLSMLRIWNYNKSRVHSYRGVRAVRVSFSGQVLFDGEVRKAPGDLTDASQAAECLLFTTDALVLERLFGTDDEAVVESAAERMRREALQIIAQRRPPTADDDQSKTAAGRGGVYEFEHALRRRRRAPEPVMAFEEALSAEQGVDDILARLSGLQAGGSLVGRRPDAAASGNRTERPRTGRRPPAGSSHKHLGDGDGGAGGGALIRSTLSSAPSGLTGLDTSSRRKEEGESGGKARAGERQESNNAAPSSEIRPIAAPGRWTPWDVSPCALSCSVDARSLPRARKIMIDLLETHGDQYYAGMTSLQVLVADDATGSVTTLPLSLDMLDASPKDINVDGHSGDPRTLDKLIDGHVQTTDDTHMWLIPFDEGERHWLSVDLQRTRAIAGLVVHNYNKSPDDVGRGLRAIRISLDGKPVVARAVSHPHTNDADGPMVPVWSTGVAVRVAAGDTLLPFGQVIALCKARRGGDGDGDGDGIPEDASAVVVDGTRGATAKGVPEATAPRALTLHRGQGFFRWPVRLVSEPPPWPRAQTIRLVLPASIGDLYYLGLDDLAVYDATGARVRVAPRQVTATPSSVRDLASSASSSASSSDGRLPSNLAFDPAESENPEIGPPGCSSRGRRPWLAPLAHSLQPGEANLLQIAFDAPVTLGGLRIRNYSKTPARGAAAVAVWLDNLLVFTCPLRPATSESERGQFIPLCPSWPQMGREKEARSLPISTAGSAAVRTGGSDHVVLWDEKQRRGGPTAAPVSTAAAGVAPDLSVRPGTSVAWAGW